MSSIKRPRKDDTGNDMEKKSKTENKHAKADRILIIRPDFGSAIVAGHKTIENRTVKLRAGLYYLRTTAKRCDQEERDRLIKIHSGHLSELALSSIVALVRIDDPIDRKHATPSQLKWCDPEGSCLHHPVTLLYKFDPPISCPLFRGPITIAKIPASVLPLIIRAEELIPI